MYFTPEYIEVLEKLARNGDHFEAIKSIDEIYEKYDSLDKIEKFHYDLLKATCMIHTDDLSNALEILKEMDPEFADPTIATLKMKTLANPQQLENAVDISQLIMANDDANWRDNVDFLLESYKTWSAYWTNFGEGDKEPSKSFTWEKCNSLLEEFLKPAMLKNSKNIELLLEVSTTISIMAITGVKDGSEKFSYNARCEIMKSAGDYLLKAQRILENSYDSKKRAEISRAYIVYYQQWSDVEETNKNHNKEDVLRYKSKALQHLTYAMRFEPGNAVDWYTKSFIELELGEKQNAFYSLMTAFNVNDWKDNDAFQENLKGLVTEFNEEQKSQLLEVQALRQDESDKHWL
ncbi:hypothetical protein OAK30_02585 [Candidatus Nitrosopelagicus sp.]|nr:hypothetical protein [Candidatus Nitrosopelagicus sp.]